jgi:hypothetical protein
MILLLLFLQKQSLSSVRPGLLIVVSRAIVESVVARRLLLLLLLLRPLRLCLTQRGLRENIPHWFKAILFSLHLPALPFLPLLHLCLYLRLHHLRYVLCIPYSPSKLRQPAH